LAKHFGQRRQRFFVDVVVGTGADAWLGFAVTPAAIQKSTTTGSGYDLVGKILPGGQRPKPFV